LRREIAELCPQASLRAQRSNPFFFLGGEMDCFASLAMTMKWLFEI
jgi:hypothetical protein